MKKYFFTMMTTAMLFASCSSDDTVAPNNGTENQEDLVEIKLGAGSRIGTSVTESRAAIESLSSEMTIGLFALDKANNSGDWTDTERTNADRTVFWDNLSASFGPTNAGYTEVTTTEKYYYPRKTTNVREYNFYAYYPYNSTTDAVTYEANKVTVTSEDFDGTQDIIWGMTEKTSSAWNADYVKNNPTSTPNIEFVHLLARLNVKIQAGTDYEATTCGVTDLTINHPTKYALTVADKAYTRSETDKNEVITFDAGNESNPTTADLNILNADNLASTIVLDPPTNSILEVGEILVQGGLDSYTLKLTLSDGSVNDVTLNTTNATTNGKIEAGYQYNVTLTINGPQEITITATLEPWGNGGEVTGEI